MPRTFIESTDRDDPADQPVDYCLPCWNKHHINRLNIPLSECDHPDYDDDPGWYKCENPNCENVLTERDN